MVPITLMGGGPKAPKLMVRTRGSISSRFDFATRRSECAPTKRPPAGFSRFLQKG